MDFVEELKSSVDIVKTIGEYVRLKRTGSSARYTGLCPFHSEKTPSFSVHAGHQFYKCFGCGAGGDVLKFVMEIERISFFEALKLLAERNGIAMPRREYSDPESKLRGALMEMHEIAARTFHANLTGPAGAEARDYLLSRNVSTEQAAEFDLGTRGRFRAATGAAIRVAFFTRANGAVRARHETPGRQRTLRSFSRTPACFRFITNPEK